MNDPDPFTLDSFPNKFGGGMAPLECFHQMGQFAATDALEICRYAKVIVMSSSIPVTDPVMSILQPFPHRNKSAFRERGILTRCGFLKTHMKSPSRYFFLLIGCVALVACDSSSVENAASADAGKSAAYLASVKDDYRKILTADDVLTHIQLEDPAELKMITDPQEATGQGQYGGCTYEWPSDRPAAKIRPQFPAQPDMNSVRISHLSISDGDSSQALSRFQTTYKPMTSAELEAATARMKKQFEGKPADQLETAMGFLKSRANSKFQAVEEIGDAAYWRPTSVMDFPLGSELVVLTGTANFTITAKASSDDEKNLELAKNLAREILAKSR